MRRLALTIPIALLAACSATPPANWAQGGTQLDIPRARWVWGEVTVDVAPDGKVFLNGEHELNVDRGGRVFDIDGQAVALLEPDGTLVGPDDEPLGMVGALHASLPDESNAWLSVTESGEVIRYDDEGERSSFGVWLGCNRTPRAHQTCTLLSHLLGMRLRDSQRRQGGGFSMGVGIGVGIPIR